MMSEEVYYGGAIFKSITGTLQTHSSVRVWTITATVGPHIINLPDARILKTGGPYFYIINLAGSNDISLRDKANIVLETVSAGELVLCALIDNTTIGGKWFRIRRTLVT